MAEKYDSERIKYVFQVNSRMGIPEEQTALAIAESYGKEEEMVEVLQQRKKSLPDLLEQICFLRAGMPGTTNAPKIINAGDYIELENLVCVDADGNVFEKYDKLYVRTDVEKNLNGRILKFTPYNSILHCEQEGNFSPSSALMANIYVTLYHAAVEKQADGTYRTKDAVLEAALQKLKNRGDGIGGNWANTLVDWWRGQGIIHYPQDGDFSSNGGTANINSSCQRVSLPFDRSGFADKILANALSLPNYKKFLQNYTGLPDPAVLIDVAEYFGKPTTLWFPWWNQAGASCAEKRAASLGCDGNSFNLFASDGLNGSNAARGVRRG